MYTMDFIQTGKIVNTHGIKGELKVESWARTPEELLTIHTLFIDNKPYKVQSSRIHKNAVLIKFFDITDIDSAEKLRNKIIYAKKSDFKLKDREYFIEDLIGIKVYDIDSKIYYGSICDVIITGANDVYDIQDQSGKHRLVPAIPDCIIQTDIQSRMMQIRPLKGLFDE